MKEYHMYHIKAQKISALIDGELSPHEKSVVLQHLTQCSKCQKIMADLQGIDDYLLYDKKEMKIPAFFETGIINNIKNRKEIKTNELLWLPLFKSKLRFVTVILLALGIFLGSIIGTNLVPLFVQNHNEIDITSVFLSQDDIASLTLDEIVIDFIREGEPS